MNDPGGAGMTGGRVRTAVLPTVRWGVRGYDQRAVDNLLLDCADTIDLLNSMVEEAHQEIGRLTGGGHATRPTRSVGLEMLAIGRGRRARRVPASTRSKRVRRRGPSSPARVHA